jgi:hypothetical protein
VGTSNDAALAYGLMGDDTPATSFAVELSLVDGKARLDQIVTWDQEEAGGGPGTPSQPTPASDATMPPAGSGSVSVSIASNRVTADALQSALVGYTNTSGEVTSVPVPLDARVRITDSENRVVPDELESTVSFQPKRRTLVPPGATVYGSVRFMAPRPGHYTLSSRANGLWSPSIDLEATY